ncbi:site-specific integrase [Cytophaga sp. FL35]|uniref:site-specific integrase n=1 Tax=Cytophaga sp. FL35 TaxID=1904456 RepID=UPI0016534B7B|nr:site-specific integrase [Cytophaga sp. FL35]MBC7000658.1 site-specific integrase [Cytophaga sp. FL35]
MRSTSTFSILFWQYAQRANANNEAGLYVRISLNGQKANISLKKKIDIDRWDSKKQRAKGFNTSSKLINEYLEEVKTDLFQLYRELKSNGSFISVEKIKSNFLGENKKAYYLSDVFNFHNTTNREKLASKTLCHYRTNQKYIMEFVREQFGKSDYPLYELNYSFLLQFESYLRSYQPRKHYRKRIANNAVMKHIQRFRKQIKLAIELEWIQSDPFIRFKPNMEKRQREFLNQDELQKIIQLKVDCERLDIVKDLFLFSCHTGISYGDIVNLKARNIEIGIDGNKWISAKRNKNGNLYELPLLDISLELINKYLGHPKTKFFNTLFPRISNQKLNSYLKEVADLCGIKKNLTFHMARHTFATTVTLSNGVPIETVSKMLGHTKLATTQIYARVLKKKISEDMLKLRNKLRNEKVKEIIK